MGPVYIYKQVSLSNQTSDGNTKPMSTIRGKNLQYKTWKSSITKSTKLDRQDTPDDASPPPSFSWEY